MNSKKFSVDAERQFASLEARGRTSLEEIKIDLASVVVSRFADMRYRGQEHTLKIRLPAKMLSTSPSEMRNAFEAEYTKRYGHSSQNVPIDLVNLRVVVTGIADKPVLKSLNGGGDRRFPGGPSGQF